MVVARSLQKLNMSDERRRHKGDILATRSSRQLKKRRLVYVSLAKLVGELASRRVGEPGAHAARVDQTSLRVVLTHKNGSNAERGRCGLRKAANHEVVALDALGLLPARRPALAVRMVPPLRDDPLDAHAGRLFENLRTVADDVVAVEDPIEIRLADEPL
jgi:hypothetical protein